MVKKSRSSQGRIIDVLNDNKIVVKLKPFSFGDNILPPTLTFDISDTVLGYGAWLKSVNLPNKEIENLFVDEWCSIAFNNINPTDDAWDNCVIKL